MSRNVIDLSAPKLALSEKYRPQRLADMVGQSCAVEMLKDFAAFPYPQAFIFHGATGTGKTTAGMALARELGVNMDWNYLNIRSGEMNDDAVNVAYKMLRQVGIGDNWKLVLCDEADLMTPKARGLWLSILDGNIPAKSVIVFTTNHFDKFEQRFIDRCEQIKFESVAKTLRPDAQAYLNRIWIGERMQGNPPNIEDVKGIAVEGVLSFRRIAQFVQQEKHKPVKAKPVISLADHEMRKAVRL